MGLDFRLHDQSNSELNELRAELDDEAFESLYDEGSHPDACPHFSYGGFHTWRQEVAAAAGFDLTAMEGFTADGTPWPEWDGVSPSVVPLLNHSDCDGDLSPDAAKAVAEALRVLDLPEGYYAEYRDSMVEMLQAAADRRVWVIFC